MGDKHIVAAGDVSINGHKFAAGDVLGELREGKPVATAPGVTAGNLAARLRSGEVIVGDPRQFAPREDIEEDAQDDSPRLAVPYADLTQRELLDEVNSRRTSGRNVTIGSNKKHALIAALEKDDAAHDAASTETAQAPPKSR